jgi:hypothetical protein
VRHGFRRSRNRHSRRVLAGPISRISASSYPRAIAKHPRGVARSVSARVALPGLPRFCHETEARVVWVAWSRDEYRSRSRRLPMLLSEDPQAPPSGGPASILALYQSCHLFLCGCVVVSYLVKSMCSLVFKFETFHLLHDKPPRSCEEHFWVHSVVVE